MSLLPEFDELVHLAKEPGALERLRQEMTRKLIESAATPASREKLERLAAEIEQEREQHATALARYRHFSELVQQRLQQIRMLETEGAAWLQRKH